jgi:hypothetical protein
MLRTIRVSKINANKYATEESNMTVSKPEVSAIIIATTGARTEKQAFIAHAQGTRDLYFSPSIPKPVGKGIPIKKPMGITESDNSIIFV